MSTRPCQATGCTTEIQRGKLMCRAHWFSIPQPLRRQINATWRAFQQGEGEARLGALKDYREATEEAVRVVGSAGG